MKRKIIGILALLALIPAHAEEADSLKNSVHPIADADQRITRGMTSLSIENRYARTSGALSFFYNWGNHWINDGYAAGKQPRDYRFNSRDKLLGVSWYQSARLFRGNRLTAGVDYYHVGGEAWNRYAEAAKAIADHCGDKILCISVANNLSVDCDCDASPEDPKMGDIGILASLDHAEALGMGSQTYELIKLD